MRLAFKTKKSAGVRVVPRVYRLIKQGDTARDAGRWHDAIAAYRAALALAPRLPHIFVQLGHALKHAGQFGEADGAYAEAARLQPDSIEPLLQRGRLAKLMNRPVLAAHSFAAALRLDGQTVQAREEIIQLLEPVFPISIETVGILLREIEDNREMRWGARPSESSEESAPSRDSRPLVFDLTDLVGHFRHQRLPTGIQRVQIEVLTSILSRRKDREVKACCFVNGRDDWLEVPLNLCHDVLRLSSMGGDVADSEWEAARIRLFLHLALSDPFILPMRSLLINLGTSLWVRDYFRFVRNAKADRDIKYIPLIYDMIPLVGPQWCVRGITEDFATWLVGIFQHADGFLAISEATKRDLMSSAARLGHALKDELVEVVPLDADFRRPADALPTAALSKWGLENVPFVLLVSTIEPRKNHILAFEAWSELLRRHGARRVPKLVCVGRDGWLNDQVFDRLDSDATLTAQVLIIQSASDAELALLYRACEFTVYPSLYEGWGLPVTESLCHGRVPVIADNSSLPEAGGKFAVRFASDSVVDFVRAVELVTFDDGWREIQEKRIAEEFTSRPWRKIAEQIESVGSRILSDTPPAFTVPAVRPNLYYPVTLYNKARIWRGLGSGEIFRMGEGWSWPETSGCRTNLPGGELRMHVDDYTGEALLLYLHLRGLASIECTVTVIVNGQLMSGKTLRRGKGSWLSCELPSGLGPELSILVRGSHAETVQLTAGGVEKPQKVSIAVIGFCLCKHDDPDAIAAFLRARWGDLEQISAYRERT